jgi:hypothetical protein
MMIVPSQCSDAMKEKANEREGPIKEALYLHHASHLQVAVAVGRRTPLYRITFLSKPSDCTSISVRLIYASRQNPWCKRRSSCSSDARAKVLAHVGVAMSPPGPPPPNIHP